jgi:hypothetical protein
MASTLIGEDIFESGPGRVNRKEASGGSGVEVIVGVKVAVGVRVGEGPRLGVNCLVGQAVSVAEFVGVELSTTGSWLGVAVSLGASAETAIATASGSAVSEAVAVFCAMVGEGGLGALPGTLNAWQAASKIKRPTPAVFSRSVLFIQLPVFRRAII